MIHLPGTRAQRAQYRGRDRSGTQSHRPAYLVQVGGCGNFPDEPEWDPDHGRLLLTLTD